MFLIPLYAENNDNNNDEYILIDSGFNKNGKELKRFLASRQLGADAIKAVFLTHAHADHVGALHMLPASVRTFVSAADREVLSGSVHSEGPRPSKIDRARARIHLPPSAAVPHVNPEVVTNHQEFTDFGDLTIQALEMPGHTSGSMGYLVRHGLNDQPTDFFPGDALDFRSNGTIKNAHEKFSLDTVSSAISIVDASEYIRGLNIVHGVIAPSHSADGDFWALYSLHLAA
jgi:glyoxylase-like metal-dependent hydrolase (beta-lactamase superfamily II)